MDDLHFDELARRVAGLPSRRRVLRTLAGGAAGGLLAAAGLSKEAGAVRCEADTDCDGCQRCDSRGRCIKGCRSGKKCCGGACVDPRLCCSTPEDCGPCRRCADGRCVARPDGKLCSGSECMRCKEGRCAVQDHALCPAKHKCDFSTRLCCRKCVDGACCRAGSKCVNPGLLSDNFCCKEPENQACGDNGDGSFRACCSSANEKCVDGECVPKSDCPSGQLTAAGICCSGDFPVTCEFGCCAQNASCCGAVCCPNDIGFCSGTGAAATCEWK